MAQVKFYRGEYANYNKTTHKDGIFFAGDKHLIIMNGVEYGGVNMSQFEGFIKDVDVEGNVLSFKKDVEGTWTDVSIKLLEAADKSIVLDTIKNGGVTDGSTIKVNVKAVGDADDGLKLGNDGLYVDLTKTTASITANTQAIADEKKRAEAAEKANADNITNLNADKATAGSVDNKIDTAIKSLDVNSIGGEGKFVKSVSETDGKIAAEVGDLVSTAVTRTATTNVAGQVDMSGTTVEGALVDLAKAVSETKKGAATYKINKVTEGLATNVKEAYQLVQTVNGVASNIGVQIPIYKDQTLKSVELVSEDDKNKKGQFMKYTYINADGADTIVYVDCSKLLAESEFKNGLALSDAGEVSVKIDTTSESFLTVGEGGVKLAGVKTAIDAAKNEVQNNLNTEITRAEAAEDKIEASVGLAADGSHVKATGYYTSGAETVVGEIAALDTQVKDNADNITTISGNVTTNASDIAKLKTTVSGHTTSINTLNGVETVEGSVKHTAKGYADNALASANAYTDTSLTWIEAGNY